MDMDSLMTRQGMRSFTDDRRETHTNDAVEIRQMVQIIHARLANTQIDGDGTGTASRRARKVTRPLRKAARMLEKVAAEMEAFNAVYVRDVLELPDRRAKDADRKALRRQRLGIAEAAVSKSLSDGVNALNGQPSPPVTPINQAPQYVNPTPHQAYAYPAPPQHQPTGNIGDFFPEAL